MSKKTFKELMDENAFRVDTVAFYSFVPEIVVMDMLDGDPVKIEDAKSVLRLISQWTQHEYSLDTVQVTLRRTFSSKSEVANLLQRIDEEQESIDQALHGYASVTRHEFISRKYLHMGLKMQEYGMSYDDDVVMQALTDWSAKLASVCEFFPQSEV